VRPRGESFFSTPFVLSSTLTAARTLTHTRTHSTRARARTRVHTLTDTRHRHTLHTRNRTRPNARARTERSFSLSLSLQPSLNGYVPSPSKLCPPSLPPPPPLLPPTTVHSRPLFPLLLFFFVSLFRPSFALSPSHRRCWRCPCTLSTCSTSHPRSNAAGMKGRSLVTPDSRPSFSREFLTSALSTSLPSKLTRVLRTPGFLYAVRISCHESDSPRCRLSRSVEPTRTVTASPRASLSRSGVRGN